MPSPEVGHYKRPHPRGSRSALIELMMNEKGVERPGSLSSSESRVEY